MTERKRQKKPAAIRSMAELSEFKIQFAESTDGETLNKGFAQREAYLDTAQTGRITSFPSSPICWVWANSILKMCMNRRSWKYTAGWIRIKTRGSSEICA